jgi:hypothetical protein
MRAIGYCEQCQRIRMVTVRMSMLASTGQVRGMCHQCEEQEELRRKEPKR